MAKIGVICYHKNLLQYPVKWIEDFKQSILTQTFSDFVMIEVCYGGEGRIFDGVFIKIDLETHADAMNHALNHAFYELHCDYVFNTNIDDIYEITRFETQLKFTEYDIVSSNFSLFNDSGVFLTHRFEKVNIERELQEDHNIICHPVVMYSRKFWNGNFYDSSQIPREDLELWKRSISDYKYIILPDVLCFHREHTNSVGRQ